MRLHTLPLITVLIYKPPHACTRAVLKSDRAQARVRARCRSLMIFVVYKFDIIANYLKFYYFWLFMQCFFPFKTRLSKFLMQIECFSLARSEILYKLNLIETICTKIRI